MQPDKPAINHSNTNTADSTIIKAESSAIRQTNIVVNDNSALNRGIFREQETKDFDKTISQAQQIIGIARGYMSDVVQFSGGR